MNAPLRPVPPPSEPPPARADQPAGSHGRPGFFGSLRHAYEGLMHATTQRNMKAHIVSAVLVGLVGSGVKLGLAEKVTLIFCVVLVFFAEILNTALEALVDLHTEDFHKLAKTTKDAAAAGVLVLAFGTVVIFAAIVVHNWELIAENWAAVQRQFFTGVPLAIIVGLLLWDRPRRQWVDHLLFCVGLAIWAVLWGFTQSFVFTTLTGALAWLSWRASKRIHHW